MKFVVFSMHPLSEAIGSRTRILSMLQALSVLYGSSQVHWVNIQPTRFANFFRPRTAMRELVGGAYSQTLMRYLKIPFINPLLAWTLPLFVAVRLLALFGRSKDVVLFAEVTSSGAVLLLYKKLSEARLVVDIHGTVDERIQYGATSRSNIVSYARGILYEATVLSKANALIFVSERMKKMYESRYGNILPVHRITVPSLVTESVPKWSVRKRSALRRTLGLEQDAFVFIYSGGTHPWQCLDATITLFDKLRRTDAGLQRSAQFVLLLWDSSFDLRGNLRRLGIAEDRVLLRTVDQSAVQEYLMAADVGFILREPLTTNMVSAPTKAPEYLAAGLPIVCTEYVGDLPDIIRESKSGYVLNDKRDATAASLVHWCRSVKKNRMRLALRCQETAKIHFGKHHIEGIRQLIQHLA